MRPAWAAARTVRDQTGRPTRMVGVNLDVTARKHVEEQLRDSERFLKAITDALPGLVGYWDRDLRCRFANRQYIDWYGRDPQEMRGMAMRELLGDELFFRNEPQFDAIETVVLPEVFQARRAAGADTVRIWSAACSSGEEPYTLAMIFQEKLRHRFPGMRMEVVGTDISATVLHAARKGSYGDYATRNTPPLYLQKYFTAEGPRRTVKDDIRAMVRFEHLNLFERSAMRGMRDFDLVLCRNVMIYFDAPAKVQVVSDLYDSLRFGGYLVIGYSELLHGISNAFRVMSFPKTTLYKKER